MSHSSRQAPAHPRGCDRAEMIRVIVLGAAVASWLLVLAAPVLRGAVYRADDLGNFHLPLRVFAAQTWNAGGSPAWCPSLFLGFDLHGEGQVGLAHPLHRLAYTILTIPAAFGMEVLAPMPLAALGTLLFLRRHGLPWSAAGLGGCSFGFGGFLVAHHVHPNASAVGAHLPWLLIVCDSMIRPHRSNGSGTELTQPFTGRPRFVAVAISAAIVGSMALLGHPQMLLYVSLSAVGYGLMMEGRAGWRERIVGLSLLFATGGAIGAAQLLPTWDAMGSSYRGEANREFSGLFSLHPLNLHQPFVPLLYQPRVVAPALPLAGFVTPAGKHLSEAHAREFALYHGTIVPVAIAWLLIRRGHLRNRGRLISWCLGMIALGLVLAFGVYTPLFSLTSRLPVLNLFRAPARFILLAQFGAACLVGLSAADAIEVAKSSERTKVRGLSVPLAIGVAICFLFQAFARIWPATFVLDALASPIGPLFSLTLLLSTTMAFVGIVRGLKGAVPCLMILTMLDLGGHAIGHLRIEPLDPPARLFATHRAPALGPFDRLLVEPPATNLWMGQGRGLVGGYAAIFPSSRLDYEDTAALRVAGVRWSIGETVTERPDRLSFARLVSEVKVSTGDPRVDLASIDVVRAALVDREMPLESGPPGRVEIERADPGWTTIRADAPSRQLLIVADRYHPGWIATLDGRPRTVHRVNGDFLGCVVPAGHHRVELRFDPASHRIGIRWSILGLVAAFVLGGCGIFRGRQQKRTSCESPGTHTDTVHASAAPRLMVARSSDASSNAATRSMY